MASVSSIIRDALASAARELMLDSGIDDMRQAANEFKNEMKRAFNPFTTTGTPARAPKYIPDEEDEEDIADEDWDDNEGLDEEDVDDEEEEAVVPPPLPKKAVEKPKPEEPNRAEKKPAGNPQSLYSERLEMLIDAAVADGVVNEKEMKVLARQAVIEQVEPNEFQMVVEARLYERQRQLAAEKRKEVPNPDPAPSAPKPATPQHRKVNKCPSCGAILNAYAVNCPQCGYLLVNEAKSEKVNEFFAEISPLEIQAERRFKSLDDEGDKEWVPPVDSEVREVIAGFVCPTSGAEMIRFMTMAANHVRFVGRGMKKRQRQCIVDYNKLWVNKMNEVYQTAESMMRGDRETLGRLSSLLGEARQRDARCEALNAEAEKKEKTKKLVTVILIALVLLITMLMSVTV